MTQENNPLYLAVDVHQKGEKNKDLRVTKTFPISNILFIRTGKSTGCKNSAQLLVENYPNQGDAPTLYTTYDVFKDICNRIRQLAQANPDDQRWIIPPYIFSPIGLKLVVREDAMINEDFPTNTLHIQNYTDSIIITTKKERADAQRAWQESCVNKSLIALKKNIPYFMQIGQEWEKYRQECRDFQQLKQDVKQMKRQIAELTRQMKRNSPEI